jgi:hypothetical protein
MKVRFDMSKRLKKHGWTIIPINSWDEDEGEQHNTVSIGIRNEDEKGNLVVQLVLTLSRVQIEAMLQLKSMREEMPDCPVELIHAGVMIANGTEQNPQGDDSGADTVDIGMFYRFSAQLPPAVGEEIEAYLQDLYSHDEYWQPRDHP